MKRRRAQEHDHYGSGAAAPTDQTSGLDLFDPLPPVPTPAMAPPQKTVDELFAEFHAANPTVLEELERRCLALHRQGHKRIGIRMLWESMRYDFMLRTTTSDDFKLNDHYTARYARLLVERHPELAEKIERRDRKEGGP